MPVLSICNHKGGTGKTTSAIHVAAAYGLSGKKVLLIDLDPQGFLTRLLGEEEPREEESSLALFDSSFHPDKLVLKPMKHFDLLPASYGMTKTARRLNNPMDVFWVKEALETMEDYDLIMLDTAAAMTVYSLNALVASDVTVIPVTPEYQPVVGAEQTYSTARLVRDKLNPKLEEPLFLLTQVDGRKRDHQSLAQYMRTTYKDQVLKTEIRTSASLAGSAEGGETVFDRELQTRGAFDYANAADEIGTYIFPGTEVATAAALQDPGPEEQPFLWDQPFR